MQEEPSLLPPSREMLCQIQPQFPQLGKRNIALTPMFGAWGEGNRRWIFFSASVPPWLC